MRPFPIPRAVAPALAVFFVASGCSSSGDTKPEVTLSSISIAPEDQTIEKGETLQFTATATYSDGHAAPLTNGVIWSSSADTVATIGATGLASGVANATAQTTITATYQGKSDSTTLHVAYLLKSIRVDEDTASVPVGFDHAFTVTGTYSGGATAPITSSIAWESTANASISAAGVATGISVGEATVTAAHGGLSDTAILTVTDAVLQNVSVQPSTPSIPAGQTVQLAAYGTFSDSTTRPLLSGVTWSDDASGHASVNASGLVMSASPGSTVVRATHTSGLFGEATVTVTPAAVASITVAPPTATIEAGATIGFTADVLWTDQTHTTAVTWESSNTGVATIDPATGVATGIAAGTVTITARTDGMSGTATLRVNPPIQHVTITPDSPVLYLGDGSTQLHATAVYGTVPPQEVTDRSTWSVSPDGIAIVSSSGVATPVSPGGARVTATYSGVSGTTYVYVGERIALDALPVTATVAPDGGGGIRLYEITGVTAHQLYEVTATNLSGNVSLGYATDPAFRNMTFCTAQPGTTPESCHAMPTSSSLYVEVLGMSGTPTFTLGVAATVGPPLTAAIDASLPYDSASVSSGEHYYRITGLTPGSAYTLTMSNLTADLNLDVVSDRTFVDWVCSSWSGGTTSESCGFLANAQGEIFVDVSSFGASSPFRLTVAARPDLPVTATLTYPSSFAGAGYTSSIGTGVAQYYRVTGLSPGASYAIAITGLPSVAAYAEATGAQSQCVFGVRDCIAIASTSGELWLGVDPTSGGGSFTISLAPVTMLGYPGSFPYDGSGSGQRKPYRVTGLTAGATYTLGLSNLGADLDVRVYHAVGAVTTPLCESENPGTASESCTFTVRAGAAIYAEVNIPVMSATFRMTLTP